MYNRYQPDIVELAARRIAATSANTYQTGANHFNTFLTHEQVAVSDLLEASTSEIHHTAACFVTYLSHLKKRNGAPIDHKTINQYLSHVVYQLTNMGIIDSTSDFRCPTTERLINAIKLRDSHIKGPLRERISIALSLPVIEACIHVACNTYTCNTTVIFITGALYIGFALSLRPDDYLVPVADNNHRLRGCQLAFWFSDYSRPFFVHQLHPPHFHPPSGSKPIRLSVIIDFDKANSTGGAGMRACGSVLFYSMVI